MLQSEKYKGPGAGGIRLHSQNGVAGEGSSGSEGKDETKSGQSGDGGGWGGWSLDFGKGFKLYPRALGRQWRISNRATIKQFTKLLNQIHMDTVSIAQHNKTQKNYQRRSCI